MSDVLSPDDRTELQQAIREELDEGGDESTLVVTVEDWLKERVALATTGGETLHEDFAVRVDDPEYWGYEIKPADTVQKAFVSARKRHGASVVKRTVSDWVAVDPTPTAPTPTCDKFHWIGQSFASCDQCGRPYWEHTFEPGYGENFGKTHRITNEQKAACRRKWGTPVDPTSPETEKRS